MYRLDLVRVSELGNHGCSDFETARAMSCLEDSVPHHQGMGETQIDEPAVLKPSETDHEA